MRRRTLLLLTTMALILVFASGTAMAEEAQLDQEWATHDTTAEIYNGAWGYQTAKAGVTGTMSKVAVLVGCCGGTNAPAGDLRVTVSSGDASTTATMPKETFTNDDVLRWVDVALNSPIPVQAANPVSDITITLRSTSDSSPYLWALDTKSSGGNAGGYSRGGFVGCYIEIPRFGIIDCNPTNADANFRTYVTPGPDAVPPRTEYAGPGDCELPWYVACNNVSPGDTIEYDSPTFRYYSNEIGSTFECKMDNADWEDCTSPKEHTDVSKGSHKKSYSGLSNGSHTFQARATDPAGNVDPTPLSIPFTVDAPPPPPVITGPANNSIVTNRDFAVSGTAEANSTVELFEEFSWGSASLGTTTANASGHWSKSLPGVADGPHTYTARARDAAGKTSFPSNRLTVDVRIPPLVVDVSPADETPNVPVNTNVVATFSEAMNEASVEATDANGLPTTFTLKQGTSTVDAAVTYDPATKTATLTPSSGLASNTTYTATIKGGASGAKDAAGNALEADKVWTFTTANDAMAPSTDHELSPEPNAAGWNKENVTVKLEAADTGGSRVKEITYSATGAQQIDSVSVAGSLATVNIDTPGMTTITYFATDNAGNQESPAKTLTVKLDKSAPTLDTDNSDGTDGITPDNRQTGVSRTIAPTATFSDEMDPASLRTSIKLYRWNALKKVWQRVPATVSVEGDKATLDPYGATEGTTEQPLAANTKHKVSVSTGATNLAGLSMATPKSWTFTTR